MRRRSGDACDFPVSTAGVLDANLLLGGLTFGHRAQAHLAGIQDDVRADVAFDVELYFGELRTIERHRHAGAVLAGERTRVEGGDDVAGLMRLQNFLLDPRLRAAAASAHRDDMHVFFVRIGDREPILDLGGAARCQSRDCAG